jgi:hemolysin III
VGIFSAAVLWRRYGFWFVAPLLWGALAYTVGSVVEYFNGRWLNWIPGVVDAHGLFHLAVLVGAGLHWWFVWRFATGKVPGTAAVEPPPPGEIQALPPRRRIARAG